MFNGNDPQLSDNVLVVIVLALDALFALLPLALGAGVAVVVASLWGWPWPAAAGAGVAAFIAGAYIWLRWERLHKIPGGFDAR